MRRMFLIGKLLWNTLRKRCYRNLADIGLPDIVRAHWFLLFEKKLRLVEVEDFVAFFSQAKGTFRGFDYMMWQRRTKQQVMPRGLLEQVRLWRAVSRLGNRAICDRFARRNKNEDLTRVNRLFIPDFVWWANFERRANGARGKNAPQAVEQLCPISFSVGF